MKIICTQENLARALSFLERASGKHSSLPILSNFLLETENGQLKLSATNLEIGVVCFVGAKIEGEGEVTIPVKLLHTFIHNLPNGGLVTLSVENQAIRVSSERYMMRINGLEAKDFPIIPSRKEEYFLSLSAQSFKNALQRALPAVSVNESRMELTGVNVMFFDSEIHLAATDSFRLAEQIVPLHRNTDRYREYITNHQSVILPSQTLSEILRIISLETADVQVLFEENQVFFEVDGVQVVSRLINGKYPDYKQILPKKFSIEAELDREELLRAVRMASMFSSQQGGEVLFTISPEKGGVVISSQSSEIGENSTVLEGNISGSQELNISFNPRYILDGLNAFEGKRVIIFGNTNSTPVALREKTDDGKLDEQFLYLVMPIRK